MILCLSESLNLSIDVSSILSRLLVLFPVVQCSKPVIFEVQGLQERQAGTNCSTILLLYDMDPKRSKPYNPCNNPDQTCMTRLLRTLCWPYWWPTILHLCAHSSQLAQRTCRTVWKQRSDTSTLDNCTLHFMLRCDAPMYIELLRHRGQLYTLPHVYNVSCAARHLTITSDGTLRRA